MQKFTNAHIENDKTLAPFLLAASFNNLLTFEGSHIENGVLYWQFSPKDEAQKLTEAFYTKREPHISARDIFEAISTFWKQISEIRNGEMYYGKNNQ